MEKLTLEESMARFGNDSFYSQKCCICANYIYTKAYAHPDSDFAQVCEECYESVKE